MREDERGRKEEDMKPITHRRWLLVAAMLVSMLAAGCNDSTGPSTGAAQVTVTTIGVELDTNGYSVAIDGGAGHLIPVNDTMTFTGLSAGSHGVLLAGLASNCATQGEANPRTVNVVAGVTARVAFSVTCVATRGRILFASDRSGTPQIHTMNSDGTGVTQLTSDTVGAEYPRWSPDGTKFVYASLRSIPDPIFTLGDYVLVVRNADGSGGRALAYLNHVFVPVPSWSPDGSRIAFVSNVVGSGLQIFVVNADGTGLRQFANLSVNIGVAWSPDGSKIALSAYGGAKYNIFVLDVNDATRTQLTSTPGGTDREPAWSPDGSRIAFVSDRDGDDEIYVMNADGSGQIRLTTSAGLDLWPAWSPDGSQIAFDSHRDGNIQIYVMNVDGSGQLPITRDAWNDMMPSWAR